ncbi:Insect cuticle protein [Oryctes borbonicus]|uniref:Insect cuticle protein n=1 Tax=Oryctes borbonicus TaxID=1629725 RepID=A0A0T6BCS9_9SCAR|nr:Insect cuticle protein [Oryctes borbonicus]
MHAFIVIAAFLAISNSLPLSPIDPAQQQPAGSSTTPVPIISQTDIDNGNGNFTFGFQAGNGIAVQESGYLKQGPPVVGKSGTDQEPSTIQVIAGSFSYPAPDGTNISLNYVADENGFQPQGAHLPTPPPLPESVQRLLSQLGSAPAASNAPGLQASPSSNYEQVVEPTLASRSGKALQGGPVSSAAPASSVAPVSSAAPASSAAPVSPAAASPALAAESTSKAPL